MGNQESTTRAENLRRSLLTLASPQRVELQKLLGQDAIREAQTGIRTQRDPYGKPFAPLTSRTGQALRRTGNNIQRGWVSKQETPDEFVFGSRFAYLGPHQYGAVITAKNGKVLRFRLEGGGQPVYQAGRRGVRQVGTTGRIVYARRVVIPRRQMVPEKDTGGLGSRWFRSFSRVVERYMLRLFAQAGGS